MNKWIILLNLAIPILAEVILEWCRIAVPTDSYRSIAIWTYWVYLPGFLAAVNLLLFFGRVDASFLKYSFFMFLGLLLGLTIGYLRWAISSKIFLYPDVGTIMGIAKLLIYYICFVGVFFLIVKGAQFLFQIFCRK